MNATGEVVLNAGHHSIFSAEAARDLIGKPCRTNVGPHHEHLHDGVVTNAWLDEHGDLHCEIEMDLPPDLL